MEIVAFILKLIVKGLMMLFGWWGLLVLGVAAIAFVSFGALMGDSTGTGGAAGAAVTLGGAVAEGAADGTDESGADATTSGDAGCAHASDLDLSDLV